MNSDLNHMYNVASQRFGSTNAAVALDWAAGVACALAAYAWVVVPVWRVAIVVVVAAGAVVMVRLSSPMKGGRGNAPSAP